MPYRTHCSSDLYPHFSTDLHVFCLSQQALGLTSRKAGEGNTRRPTAKSTPNPFPSLKRHKNTLWEQERARGMIVTAPSSLFSLPFLLRSMAAAAAPAAAAAAAAITTYKLLPRNFTRLSTATIIMQCTKPYYPLPPISCHPACAAATPSVSCSQFHPLIEWHQRSGQRQGTEGRCRCRRRRRPMQRCPVETLGNAQHERQEQRGVNWSCDSV